MPTTAKHPDATPSYVGWHRRRPGHPWQRVAEGPTWAACWQDVWAQQLPSGDTVVLATGRHPDEHRRRT